MNCPTIAKRLGRKVWVYTQEGEVCRKRVERKVSDIAQVENVKWKLVLLAKGAGKNNLLFSHLIFRPYFEEAIFGRSSLAASSL
ncbi:MAG: hypothetical protein GY941_28290 [Planctomycetes bacterium]|nr:hypothetical protein [Planctomycetota bacterium]